MPLTEEREKEFNELLNLRSDNERLKFELDSQRRKPIGQNTARTLIDCINHFITACPIGCKILVWSEDYRWNLELSRNGAKLYEHLDAPNVQCCYEELLQWLTEKAIGI